MFYAHAQKQTNKHNSLSLPLALSLSLSLSLALSRCLASSALWTISFSSFKSRQDNCRLPLFFISHFKTTQLFFSYFLDTAFFFFFNSFCSVFLRHFLRRARVCLETHELFGHLVVGPLREYPHDGEASFVHGDALHQGVAGRAAARVG